MKNKSVKFTSYEKRALGLPQDHAGVFAEDFALRKIIDTFPHIVGAAEYNFDKRIVEAHYQVIISLAKLEEVKKEIDKERIK